MYFKSLQLLIIGYLDYLVYFLVFLVYLIFPNADNISQFMFIKFINQIVDQFQKDIIYQITLFYSKKIIEFKKIKDQTSNYYNITYFLEILIRQSVFKSFSYTQQQMLSWFQQPMIAYDHSPNSQIALEIFLSLKKKYSKSHIIHVFNSNKNGYTLGDVSTTTISDHLSKKFPLQSKQNSTIQLREQGNKSVNDIILESFISNGTNLLFLGFVGSKGRKPRSKDLSSRVSQFVYQSKISLAIVKRQNPDTDNVLFCFDGSQISMQGLIKANQFCQTYNKNLIVLHCTTQQLKTHSKHVKNIIKQLKITKKQLKFDFLCQQGDLINWIKQHESEFEWLIVTGNGHRGSISKIRFIGQTTSKILEQTNANLFVLKL